MPLPIFSFTTDHSRKRILERTGLTVKAVEDILNGGLYVNAGHTKPGLPRKRFLVFFDPETQQCFVAVQRVTGKIHTVLPRHFGVKTFPWITEKVYDKARRIYERSVQDAKKERTRVAPKKSTPAEQNFTVTVLYIYPTGSKTSRKLLVIPSGPYGHSIQNLLADASFPDRVQAAFETVQNPPALPVHGLGIRANTAFVFIAL